MLVKGKPKFYYRNKYFYKQRYFCCEKANYFSTIYFDHNLKYNLSKVFEYIINKFMATKIIKFYLFKNY